MVDGVSGSVHSSAPTEVPGRVFLHPNDPGETVLLPALQPRRELGVRDVRFGVFFHAGDCGVSRVALSTDTL